ncbi:Fic family protein [Neoasaia chiangmaiensis]|uniref:Fic family protein n=1 Tax=Neoasaia chiangmaiensis TaxID=320497 RepID=UPI0011BEADC6|nr:Fic family protein [Neoasaia chiangmaiensis]
MGLEAYGFDSVVDCLEILFARVGVSFSRSEICGNFIAKFDKSLPPLALLIHMIESLGLPKANDICDGVFDCDLLELWSDRYGVRCKVVKYRKAASVDMTSNTFVAQHKYILIAPPIISQKTRVCHTFNISPIKAGDPENTFVHRIRLEERRLHFMLSRARLEGFQSLQAWKQHHRAQGASRLRAIGRPEILTRDFIETIHDLVVGWSVPRKRSFRDIDLSRGRKIYAFHGSIAASIEEWVQIYGDMRKIQSATDIEALTWVIFALGDFNAVHPFPDGNGRVCRILCHWYLQSIGRRASRTMFQKNIWYGAMHRLGVGDTRPMYRLISGDL